MNKRRRGAVGWGVENQSETFVYDATISGVQWPPPSPRILWHSYSKWSIYHICVSNGGAVWVLLCSKKQHVSSRTTVAENVMYYGLMQLDTDTLILHCSVFKYHCMQKNLTNVNIVYDGGHTFYTIAHMLTS